MALSAGIITGNKLQEALRESVTNGSLRPVTKPSPSPDLSNHLPDEPGPTKRYCNLAMELGARGPGQWAVVRDAGGIVSANATAKRVVLVEGLQRLEACRSLGEKTIVGLIVQARHK